MKPILLPLLLAICSVASGQTINLEGLDRVNTGDPVSLTGTMPAGVGENYRWTVIPKPAVPPMQLVDRDGRPVLIILKSAGKSYTILLDCQIPSEGADPWHRAEKIVSVGGDQDDEKDEEKKDDEKDEDDTTPTPDGHYWIIFLEESQERTPEMATLLADAAFLKSLTDAGHKWRVYDDDHADAKSFAALTTHRPALIVTTFSGEIVKTSDKVTKEEIQSVLKGGK